MLPPEVVSAMLAQEKAERERRLTTEALRGAHRRAGDGPRAPAAAGGKKRARSGPKLPRGMEVAVLSGDSVLDARGKDDTSSREFLARARGRHKRSRDMLRPSRGFAPAAGFAR